VLLGYDLWKRRFGGDPGIVGRSLFIDAPPMKSSESCPRASGSRQQAGALDSLRPESCELAQQSYHVYVLARLSRVPPWSSARKDDRHSRRNRIPKARAMRFAAARCLCASGSRDRCAPTCCRSAGRWAFLLVIACANVAGLLDGGRRGTVLRGRLRSALGAGRGRPGAPASDRKHAPQPFSAVRRSHSCLVSGRTSHSA